MAEAKSQKPKAKAGANGEEFSRSQKLEARGQSAEVQWLDETKAEAKSQKPKAKAGANGERRMATAGSRESRVESRESFRLARALCEWRTWVATSAAFGLAVAKAAIVS
jgi:hypothetical protein